MKKLLSVILIVVTLCSVEFCAVASSDTTEFNYGVMDGEAIINYYSGNEKEVVIPSVLGGYPVTTIDYRTFSDCDAMERIVIPSSVKVIGVMAFDWCENLSEVVLSEGLQTIERCAFRYCTALTSIEIPASVTCIEEGVFEGCEKLLDCSVSYGNENYCDEDGVLFNKNKTTLITYPSAKPQENYTIPNGVIHIAEYAFDKCHELSKIVLPESIETIGDNAFFNCGINEIFIPKKVKSIGEEGAFGVFDACYNLIRIDVSQENSVYSSENGVLFSKDKRCLIRYPQGWRRTDESYVIPESVEKISASAFEGCESLMSFTLPNTITYIGADAFRNTKYYNQSENWENGVLYLGNYCIEARDSIEGTYCIKDGINLIANSAFSYCDKLEEVVLPTGLQYIGRYAFTDCAELKKITLPQELQMIDNGVFYSCRKLEDVVLPTNLKMIGEEAFLCCESLKTITIPESVTTIGDWAFCLCELEAATILGKETVIEETAFMECWNIKLYGYLGSSTQVYANENDILFVALDGEEIVLGDLNGDEQINAKDALEVLKAAVGKVNLTEEQKTAADVNKDGDINAKDALEILKKAVGKPACF